MTLQSDLPNICYKDQNRQEQHTIYIKQDIYRLLKLNVPLSLTQIFQKNWWKRSQMVFKFVNQYILKIGKSNKIGNQE